MKVPFARVLIVDDEPRSQMRIQFALESVGFQCDLAADGPEALQRIAEGRYQAVVTELILPQTNGGEFVIELYEQKSAPVVIVHTRPLEQDVYMGLKNEGVDAIFYKPTDYAVMARKIQSLVEGRSSPRTAGERLKKWYNDSAQMAEVGLVKKLRTGDEWIQGNSVRVEAFRFTIVILACILFGLGWGNSLDTDIAGVCKMFGLCGFAFYFCLELVAYHRDQHRAKLLRWSAERNPADQLAVKTEQEHAREVVPGNC